MVLSARYSRLRELAIVGVVHQHVDVEIVLHRHAEADIDMLACFLVGVFVPGQAADDVAAFLYRLFHQFGGAGVANDSFLREGDHLDAAVVFHFLAREQQAARSAQSADGSDIAEQPKECGAVLDALLEGAHGACGDL